MQLVSHEAICYVCLEFLSTFDPATLLPEFYVKEIIIIMYKYIATMTVSMVP